MAMTRSPSPTLPKSILRFSVRYMTNS